MNVDVINIVDLTEDVEQPKVLAPSSLLKSYRKIAKIEDINAKTKFDIPDIFLYEIALLILQKLSAPSVPALWDNISGIFPYFENTFTPLEGIEKTIKELKEYPNLFIICGEESSNTCTIGLHVQALNEVQLVTRKVNINKEAVQKCMFVPEYIDWLLGPKSGIILKRLYRVYDRVYSSSKSNLMLDKRKNTFEDLDSCHKAPKIDGIFSVKHDGTLRPIVVSPVPPDDEPLQDPLQINDKHSAIPENETGLFCLRPEELQMHLTNPLITSYHNSVWSHDGPSHVPSNAEDETKFYMHWRKFYPWINIRTKQSLIVCTCCEYLETTFNQTNISTVTKFEMPLVEARLAGSLNSHAEKNFHRLANLLKNKSIIAVLHHLLSFYFDAFADASEIVSAFASLVDQKQVRLTKDDIHFCIVSLARYLEHRIIRTIRNVPFTIISDPCKGILIVRFTTDEHLTIEEHIISSYSTSSEKNPLTYLLSLGVKSEMVVHNVTNQVCGYCAKCNSIPFPIARDVPLRLPKIGKFFMFIWRAKLMKPFYSLGDTLKVLVESYPFKFQQLSQTLSLADLRKFPTRPSVFEIVFEHRQKIVQIAKEIFDSTGKIHALGLSAIDFEALHPLVRLFEPLDKFGLYLTQLHNAHPFSLSKMNLDNEQTRLQNIVADLKLDPTTNNSHMSEFLAIISQTVKEYHQPIYNQGLSLPIAYSRMTNLDNLYKIGESQATRDSFRLLVRKGRDLDPESLQRDLRTFFRNYPHLQRQPASVILRDLHKPANVVWKYSPVFTLFAGINMMPLHPSVNDRCLYEFKMFESFFYRSAWNGIGDGVLTSLMTVSSELGHIQLDDKDIFNFFSAQCI